MSAFIISLDFEMFWGVTNSRTIENYGVNIEQEWSIVPAMLKLFKQYGIHATWATVGMLMCKDYKQWSELKPSLMPTYLKESCSTYSFSTLAHDFPKLFFAPALVEQILATDGQELASHTYSHFYCGEKNVTTEQFAADLDCVKRIFSQYGLKPTNLVFPRNQVNDMYLKVLFDAGFTVYRGNQNHWVYRKGHFSSGGAYKTALRYMRYVDNYLPLTGNHVISLPRYFPEGKLANIPVSMFLRPISNYPLLDWMHMNRIKKSMLEAAKTKSVFHIWWHPHNFGQRSKDNLTNLENILKFYQTLNQKYCMQSLTMKELELLCRIQNKKLSY